MSSKLTQYEFPDDISEMTERDMELLSFEIRDFLISSVSKTGGHLASNLGVVELTIALHKVFDSPKDKIIWDVGHQSYVHKILTGRADRFHTLRQENGLAGFPKREESPHDQCNTGHSSTSISQALGFAEARNADSDYDVVAVIGDGALTGGPAYEGLNNVGHLQSKMIVVLNDNEMSIGENIGGMSKHLSRLRTSKTYLNLKSQIKKTLKRVPGVGNNLYNGAERVRDAIKYAASMSGGIFEDLGFKYFGPIDGHNIHDLIEILEVAKLIDGPVIIHTLTKKGKGYRNAEQNPEKFHGIGPFNAETGKLLAESNGETYSKIFGEKLTSLAENDESIIAITAAMGAATGLAGFAEKFPDRIYDVGIAEAHAVSFAAGLAASGKRPFVAIYSTFLQRAYDQILLDVCMQNLPVVFCIDRAGNVGQDGETHHGVFDLSYLSHIPNLTIMAPRDGEELKRMMDYACTLEGPVAIRYPRGSAPDIPGISIGRESISQGRSERLIEGDGTVDIWAVGKMVEIGRDVCKLLDEKDIDAGLVNARFVKPPDLDALALAAAKGTSIIVLEDNVTSGGFGETILAELNALGFNDAKVKSFAWPDKFIGQGNVPSLMKKYGLDAESIAEGTVEFLESTS